MKDLKLLLVDDEEEFVSALAERLQLRGIETITASNGEEALARVEEDLPHVVVLDVMMPGLGGVQILEQIKTSHPEIEVILLTGQVLPDGEDEGMRHGAFACLIKPLSVEELIQKIYQATGYSEEDR